MILSRTPFRLSFFGGGTDYPAWYRREGGAVLSTTIDKYCYLSVRHLPPFFTTRHRVVWSHVETVGTIAEILHPAWENYDLSWWFAAPGHPTSQGSRPWSTSMPERSCSRRTW